MVQDHWLPGFNFNVEEWDDQRAGEPKAKAADEAGSGPRPAPANRATNSRAQRRISLRQRRGCHSGRSPTRKSLP